MVKRKRSKIVEAPSPPSPTISESDSELELSSDRLSITQQSNSLICSTPVSEFLSSFIGSSAALQSSDDESLESFQPNVSETKYDNFTSFLKSFSLASGSEDEEAKLSASRQNGSASEDESPSLSEVKYSRKLYHEQKRAYESCRSLMETSVLGTRIIIVQSKNLEIVSLQHPASVTLHGYLKVSVFIGSISILGHTVHEGKKTEVFSTESTTLLNASTLKSTPKSSIKIVRKKLNRLVPKNQSEELNEFFEQVGPGTVVIVLEKSVLPPPLQFLENYFPPAVQTSRVRRLKPRNENERLCSAQEDNVFTVSSDCEGISEEIIRNSLLDAEFGPRIVMYGTKRTGKSTLLRYLINKTLNKVKAVYYLDMDPGQTEFTPPGVVSLVRVTEPLLGPPYSHQRKPLKMIFTGSVSAETSPPMYIKSVISLFECFSANFPKETLFVNTMGWIQGIGGICFQNVMEVLNPTMMIEFVSPDDLPEMKKTVLANGGTSYQIPIKPYSNPSSFGPVELRNFALMSYLGKCQKYYMEPTYLHAFRPVVVCWDKIAVFVMGSNVPPSRLIEVIHSSVVGLCRVNRNLMLESDKPEFPRTLYDEPMNECIGFGLVRATDETNHLLYIVTPLTVEELKPVNAIIKGNILLPDAVYLKQDIYNLPLPYTDSCTEAPTPIRKAVRKRARKSVQKHSERL